MCSVDVLRQSTYKEPDLKNKLIPQRTSNDCGIAAIAMLTDTSWYAVNRITKGICRERKTRFDGMPSSLARDVVHRLGDELRVWACTADTRPSLHARINGRQAILVVPALGYPYGTEWHAVYWDGKTLFDPARDRSGCPAFGWKGTKALKTMHEIWVLASDGE